MTVTTTNVVVTGHYRYYIFGPMPVRRPKSQQVAEMYLKINLIAKAKGIFIDIQVRFIIRPIYEPPASDNY